MGSQRSITSITTGPRQSNFEILRILAMFLVLVVHASFWAHGMPTIQDFEDSPLSTFTLTLFQSIAIVCVNVFVLISGWFGIKPSIKGFSSFIFQCIYFVLAIYAIAILFGWSHFSIITLISKILCKQSSYWFILAYIALYIIAPVLNKFSETATQSEYKYTLIAFFTFQTILGWSGTAKFIEMGYSCFSFIGLYLLSRYIRIYGIGKLNSRGGSMYVCSIILNTLFFYIATRFGFNYTYFAYINPLVIIGSVGLLLFFNNIKVSTNKFINFIAKSAFAVYLFHCNGDIFERIFKSIVTNIYSDYSGLTCISMIFCFLIVIFAVSILIDQPRKWLWKLLSSQLNKNR